MLVTLLHMLVTPFQVTDSWAFARRAGLLLVRSLWQSKPPEAPPLSVPCVPSRQGRRHFCHRV